MTSFRWAEKMQRGYAAECALSTGRRGSPLSIVSLSSRTVSREIQIGMGSTGVLPGHA